MKRLFHAIILSCILPILCNAQKNTKHDIAVEDILKSKKNNGMDISVFVHI